MSYLEKIVGLTGTTPAPVAGVKLVNDLPIISTAFVEGISKLDTENISSTWVRIIKQAEDLLSQDLYCEIMKEDKARQLMAMSADFDSSSNPNKIASARYEGARLQAARQKNTNLFIKSLYVNGSGTYTVKIYDLSTGLEVYTSPATTTITNEGYITVNKILSLDKLKNDYLIGIDATAIELGAIDGNKGFFGDRCGSYPITITSGSIAISADKTAANFQSGNCYVHIESEVVADLTNFMEKNYDLFGLCAQYLCGSLLLNESLTTDRFNIWSNTNRIERENESIRQETMYKEYLKKVIQPVLMRLNTTTIVEPKHASEKLGIHTEDILPDYGCRPYLTSEDYPVYY